MAAPPASTEAESGAGDSIPAVIAAAVAGKGGAVFEGKVKSGLPPNLFNRGYFCCTFGWLPVG